ncbi:hypothetical protein [Helicobacter pylori]|nr:hypothetical protein [Helicobacter pylori]
MAVRFGVIFDNYTIDQNLKNYLLVLAKYLNNKYLNNRDIWYYW